MVALWACLGDCGRRWGRQLAGQVMVTGDEDKRGKQENTKSKSTTTTEPNQRLVGMEEDQLLEDDQLAAAKEKELEEDPSMIIPNSKRDNIRDQ